ncbi:trimethylamine monooxygenase-like [Ruditapes philippinarum]|uniref:trimethylamine monooxygenase-like n=1 Tax=Ruditapes philippinarum TaxID=129788 RepID=UPI00295BBCA3|nr:trimethylamine monooxygenase-like [Ruditapes philippinarum]
MSGIRICVIGAGPSGMSTLHHFARMKNMPELQIYWFELHAGLDENGEPVHSSMYKYMWCNGMKEAYEYPDYTFEQHFGQPTPSFPSRVVMRDYLEGRFTRGAPGGRDFKAYIRFNTAVRFVKYHDDKQEFTVTVNDYNTGETKEEIFSHVIVANGIYSAPNLPDFPGLNDFQGRILHSHDFRDAREFSQKKVLIVGAGYSGEDIVLHCIKFDAKRVILSHRTRPKGETCIMPDSVEEKPLVERFDSSKAYFKDGTSADIDAVILTTGYRNYFPFLEDRFRIAEETHVYPKGLYKGALFLGQGNNRLLYVGVLEQFNTLNYLEVIANWACKFIMGELEGEPRDSKHMQADADEWHSKANACASESDVVKFQTALISHLAELGGYNPTVAKNTETIMEWIRVRKESLGLANYRDNCYRSMYTGKVSPKQKPFMQNYDESIEAYLKCE